MSNPVMDRIDSQIANSKRTPKGYPTMPGYTPNSPYANPYGTGASQPYESAPTVGTYDPSLSANNPYPGTSYPQGDYQANPNYYQGAPTPQQMEQINQSWQAPAANPAGQMTYDDVIGRTGLLLGILILGAAMNWFVTMVNPGMGSALGMLGLIGGLVLALVNIFKKKPSPVLIMAYSFAEGMVLGWISSITELAYPGIVVQAVLATMAVFVVTLLLFKSGKVRYSSGIAKFTIISLVGLILYSLVSMILVWTGVIANPMGLDSIRVMGIPLGIIVGLFAVLVGSFSLIGDFEVVHQGVITHQPKALAWYCSFGIIVTLVWLYLEILRLLQLLRSN